MTFFSKEDQLYLKGEKFSNGRVFQVVRNKKLWRRIPLLEQLSEEKKVVHIGFTDHQPLIEDKIKGNIWLHDRICRSSELCVGLDIDAVAVNYVGNELGYDHVYALDILQDKLPEIISDHQFDLLILGEVLEHIDNPVHFLSTINTRFGPYAKEIVITVPNAWDMTNLTRLKKGEEFINTDHRYWFTPFTLAKVVDRSGYHVEEIYMAQSYMPESWWRRRQIYMHPLKRETVILRATFGS